MYELAHIDPHFLTLLKNKGNPEDPSNYEPTAQCHVNIVKCLDTLVTKDTHNCTFTGRSTDKFSTADILNFLMLLQHNVSIFSD